MYFGEVQSCVLRDLGKNFFCLCLKFGRYTSSTTFVKIESFFLKIRASTFEFEAAHRLELNLLEQHMNLLEQHITGRSPTVGVQSHVGRYRVLLIPICD